jgi:glycosyltransferase involved in cell wall biosynthesis
MRILYLCEDGGIDLTGRSGGSIHIHSFVRALTDLGHQITVVCTRVSSPKSLEDELRAEVRPAPLADWNHSLANAIRAGNRLIGRAARNNPDAVRTLHNLRFFRTAAKAARELDPDFIYERYSLWGMAGLRLARNRSIPHVLEVNAPLAFEQQRFRAGLTCPPLARWVERRIWRKADLSIVVSDTLRSLLQNAGARPESIHVLPNAVSPRLFHTDLDGKPVRERLNFNGRFVIGFVGMFRPWHGVDLLISVLEDLHRVDPSIHLLLVGDGPLRQRFEAEVCKAGLQEAVTFTGAVAHQDVPGYLAAMDMTVAPYPALDDFYYSPIKLFEYMAAGRPVVASRVGQVAQIIEDGVNGLLFDPGDRAGLINCVRRLKNDVALRNELGREASATCSDHTWGRNATRVVDWVAPLVNRKRLVAVSS